MILECLTDINTNNHSDRAALLEFTEERTFQGHRGLSNVGKGEDRRFTLTPPSAIY